MYDDWEQYYENRKADYEEKIESMKANSKKQLTALKSALANSKRQSEEMLVKYKEMNNAPEEFDPTIWDRVNNYGKNQLFRTMKFYDSDVMGDYLQDGSQGRRFLEFFEVNDARMGPFMSKYSDALRQGVDYQRNTSQTQIGKMIKGK